MKRTRIMVDVTDSDNVFIHKGGRRKGHVYVVFHTETSDWAAIWARWSTSRVYFGDDKSHAFMVPQALYTLPFQESESPTGIYPFPFIPHHRHAL